MPWMIQGEFTIGWVPAGAGGAALGQQQANVAGVGQSQTPLSIFNAQMVKIIDAQPVPTSAGATPTLANINTALTSMVSDLAGSGSPLITPAILATIDGWSTGNP